MPDPTAATTWWFNLTRGEETGFLILVAPTREKALADAEAHALAFGPDVVFEPPQSGDERSPCSSCPHAEPCYTSNWESPQRMGEERPFSWETRTVAHTCPLCFNPVLDVYGETTRRVVPDGCPRWGPLFCSAIECSECQAEREAIEKAHPTYQARMGVAGKFGDLLLRLLKKPKLPEGVEDLDRRRDIHDLAGEFAQVNNPYTGIVAALEDPESQVRLALAAGLVAACWGLLAARDEVQHEVGQARKDGMDDLDEITMNAEWVEAVHLALGRREPDDVSGLVREWMFAITKRGPVARAWSHIPLTERKMLVRSWEKVTRDLRSS